MSDYDMQPNRRPEPDGIDRYTDDEQAAIEAYEYANDCEADQAAFEDLVEESGRFEDQARMPNGLVWDYEAEYRELASLAKLAERIAAQDRARVEARAADSEAMLRRVRHYEEVEALAQDRARVRHYEEQARLAAEYAAFEEWVEQSGRLVELAERMARFGEDESL
jgi:hypothetical protein